jgi:hypothetical protein
VSTHSELVDFRSLGTIRIYVHATGFPDKVINLSTSQKLFEAISSPRYKFVKVPFDMYPNDLIGDLRAEVCHWWESKMADHRAALLATNSVLEKKRSSSGNNSLLGTTIDGMHLRYCCLAILINSLSSSIQQRVFFQVHIPRPRNS